MLKVAIEPRILFPPAPIHTCRYDVFVKFPAASAHILSYSGRRLAAKQKSRYRRSLAIFAHAAPPFIVGRRNRFATALCIRARFGSPFSPCGRKGSAIPSQSGGHPLSHGLEPRASDPSRSFPNVHRPATPDDLEGMGPAAPALAGLGRLVLFRGGRGRGIAAADDRRRPRDHRRRAPVAHRASHGSGAQKNARVLRASGADGPPQQRDSLRLDRLESDPAGERPRLDPERLDPHLHRRRRALSDRERKTEPAPTSWRSVRPDRRGDEDGGRSRARDDYSSGGRIRDPRGGGLLCAGEHLRPALPQPRTGADRRRDRPSHRFEPDAAAARDVRRSPLGPAGPESRRDRGRRRDRGAVDRARVYRLFPYSGRRGRDERRARDFAGARFVDPARRSLSRGEAGAASFSRASDNRDRPRPDRRPAGAHDRTASGATAHAAFNFGFSQPRLTIASAIWIALRAAPLRRLSETTQMLRPLSIVGSSRMREI